jgi:hypothetical protein
VLRIATGAANTEPGGRAGTPRISFDGLRHVTCSTMCGSAAVISARIRDGISPRQSADAAIDASISSEADASSGETRLLAIDVSPYAGHAFTLSRPSCEHHRIRSLQKTQDELIGRRYALPGASNHLINSKRETCESLATILFERCACG